MTTNDILFLIAAFKKGADFCRGDIGYWLSKDELNEIFHTLRCESNCIDFLSQGEKVRPVAMKLRKALREFLDSAAEVTVEDDKLQWRLKESARGRFKKWFDPNPNVIKLFGNDPEEIYPSTITAGCVVSFCGAWLNWIDAYFPIDPSGQEQPHQEPAQRPKRETPADDRFSSPELQEVKQELVKVGLIVDGRLDVGTADFECLVKTFSDVFGIKTKKGNLARKACASFVGFTGNLESARSSTHNEQQSSKAKLIKAICKEIHTKYVK